MTQRLAEWVGARPGRPLTAAAARKALRRAHGRYAELLVEEVVRSLGEPTAGELEAELGDLDLLRYCRSVLARRRRPAG